jgi:flagellar hook-length control protein FliK
VEFEELVPSAETDPESIVARHEDRLKIATWLTTVQSPDGVGVAATGTAVKLSIPAKMQDVEPVIEEPGAQFAKTGPQTMAPSIGQPSNPSLEIRKDAPAESGGQNKDRPTVQHVLAGTAVGRETAAVLISERWDFPRARAGNIDRYEPAAALKSERSNVAPQISAGNQNSSPAIVAVASNVLESAIVPSAPQLGEQASPGTFKPAPATTSFLSQLDQVENLRELVRTERTSFVTRLAQDGGTVQVLRLQLRPAELGNVMAQLRMENGTLTVELVAEKEAAFRQLAKDAAVLQSTMRALGVAVDEIVVSQGNGAAQADSAPQEHHRRSASESRDQSDGQSRTGRRPQQDPTAHDQGQADVDDASRRTDPGLYI